MPSLSRQRIEEDRARDRARVEAQRREADRSVLEHPGPLLSVVVPTFNERDNVRPLVGELSETLADVEWEVIFVDDDSPDGTADAVRDLARERHRVRCIHRIGRRGLASACVEGMLGSSAPYLVVMDGDLQHDPKIIPQMLAVLERHDAELVIGSRYISGASVDDSTGLRRAISRFATWVGHAVVPENLKDPLSGFFALRRDLFDDVVRDLSCIGFKILLDMVTTAHHAVEFREIPFGFRTRRAGESKLDGLVAWEYAMLLADKLVGRYVPVRFLSFALIGAAGVGVHLALLTLAYRVAQLEFVTSQAIAVTLTMVFNYAVNNMLTYRDRRRRGLKWLTGLLSFIAVCAVGAVANVGVAAYLFNHHANWLLAAVAGVVVGAVWNYTVTSVYTWGRRSAA